MNTIVRTTAAALVAVAGLAPLAAQAATSGPVPHTAASRVAPAPLALVAEGRFAQGHDLDLHGDAGVDAHGASWTRATVYGPHGMKAVLSPAADRGYLVGTIHVPTALEGTWIRLTLVAPDGHRVSTVVKHT